MTCTDKTTDKDDLARMVGLDTVDMAAEAEEVATTIVHTVALLNRRHRLLVNLLGLRLQPLKPNGSKRDASILFPDLNSTALA